MKLIQRNQEPTTEPAEPQTVETLRAQIGQLETERQTLTDERAVLDDALADLLAQRVMGGRVDAAELVGLSERKDANEAEGSQLNLTIAGLRARLDALEAAERAERSAQLLPELQTLGDRGESLIERYYRQLLALAATVAEIEANTQAYTTANHEWSRVNPNQGHGVAWPRAVWGLDPAVLYRTRAFPGVYTLAGEIEDWYTEPERKAEARAREQAARERQIEQAA